MTDSTSAGSSECVGVNVDVRDGSVASVRPWFVEVGDM
jgi:hypothetical protein